VLATSHTFSDRADVTPRATPCRWRGGPLGRPGYWSHLTLYGLSGVRMSRARWAPSHARHHRSVRPGSRRGHHHSSSTCTTHRSTSDRSRVASARPTSRGFEEQIAGQTVADRATPGVTYFTSANDAHPYEQSRNSQFTNVPDRCRSAPFWLAEMPARRGPVDVAMRASRSEEQRVRCARASRNQTISRVIY
jgi:hypothetical protein